MINKGVFVEADVNLHLEGGFFSPSPWPLTSDTVAVHVLVWVALFSYTSVLGRVSCSGALTFKEEVTRIELLFHPNVECDKCLSILHTEDCLQPHRIGLSSRADKISVQK